MIPLFAYLYNRGQTNKKNYSILSIFPYFVLGFVAMIILRNIGDQVFLNTSNEIWKTPDYSKSLHTLHGKISKKRSDRACLIQQKLVGLTQLVFCS